VHLPAAGRPRPVLLGSCAAAVARRRSCLLGRRCGLVRNSCTHVPTYVPIAHSSKYEHAWLMLRESFGFLEPPASSAYRLSWQVT